MGNADVRKLGGKPSGTIKMSDLRGKSAEIVYVKLKKVGNAEVRPFNSPPAVAYVINPVLKEFNIYFPDSAKQGSVAFSNDKIYKAVIITTKQQMISGGLAKFIVEADVYKAQ